MYSLNCMSLNPDELVNGRYKTIQELGRGGFGITYTAYDTWRESNIVVLKQISIIAPDADSESERDSGYIAKLKSEAEVLKELEHPCIPRFFESFEADNYYYIVQEYIEGHDLSQEIRPGEPIGELEALIILQEILRILQFIHSNNIIHRDIKPANIIRRHSDNKLFLIDFGAVKEVATEHSNEAGITLTRIIRCEGYTPVEQLNGHPRQNSDIYALGMMIMQAVTGFSIIAIRNPETIPLRDRKGNYIWQSYAPQIRPKYKKMISKTIECSFCDRYQTAFEILKKLPLEITPTIPWWVKLVKMFKQWLTNISVQWKKLITTQMRIQWQKLIKFIALAVIACGLLISARTNLLYLSNIIFNRPDICANLGDNISCGEEILDPLSRGSIRTKAAEEHEQKEYQAASSDYKLSWESERKDAESLIYLNNSLLEASKLDYYTIAVAVPLSSDENASIQNSKLAQGFLRGVAQAQTEINLSLSRKNALFALLPGQEILTPKNISGNSNKGLKVIILDDGNNREQAEKTAQSIAQTPEVLGVVGNYASGMTLATVDIYDQENLAQISYTSTSKRLSTNYRPNFFRVAYTSDEEADIVVEYIQSINAQQKKVAAFYSPSSSYSNYFWIEISDRLKQARIPFYKTFDLADDKFSTQLALKEAKENNANVYILLPDGQVTNALSNALEIIKYDEGNSFIVGGDTMVVPEVTELDVVPSTNFVASIFWHPFSPPNPQFLEQSQQLWETTNINNGTAMAYDAAIALIEAIKIQKKPSRKETIAKLANPEFSVKEGATGSIEFNRPKNGDRKDFYPTLIRLAKCEDKNQFLPLSLDPIQAQELGCYINE